jgi:hypothetical protein
VAGMVRSRRPKRTSARASPAGNRHRSPNHAAVDL